MELEKIANILGAETVKKIYEDAASPAVQEAGKMAADVVKTLRLFTAPIQLAASYQDRLARYFEKVRNAVPEERQIAAPASISGPIIDRLKYVEDDSYLAGLYLNLLTRSIDKERINEAHPAFLSVIEQLSPDEAFLIHNIGQRAIILRFKWEYNKIKKSFYGKTWLDNPLPVHELIFPDNYDMYISHLVSLNILNSHLEEQLMAKADGETTGKIVEQQINLNDFGRLFFKACVPPEGFNVEKQ